MNSEIKMSISSMTRHKDQKAIYVLFSDGASSAEFAIPGGKLINSRGFSEMQLKQLKDYVDNQQDYLFRIAKNVNPLKGFMGEVQGEENSQR